MDNKICTKNGCIAIKEYVLPLTEDLTSNERFLCKTIAALLSQVDVNDCDIALEAPLMQALMDRVEETCGKTR